MTKSKKYLELNLSVELAEMLTGFAKRDKVPVETKAIEFLQLAVELEEDAVWGQIASERDTPDAVYISHEECWGMNKALKA